MRKLMKLILGQDEDHQYPELYKREYLPGTRNLDFYSIANGGPYHRGETRRFDWKSL